MIFFNNSTNFKIHFYFCKKINNHMKKLSFLIFTCMILLTFQSCLSDSKCNLEGKWKVKSTDVQSTKLSGSIVEMTKAEIENTQYEFTADGKVTSSVAGQIPAEGTWSLAETGDKLVLTFPERNPETFNLTNCTSNELSVSQRAPADPSKEEILTINTVFERIK